MSKPNYHKRKDYEAQYIKLYKIINGTYPSGVHSLSDYQLLSRMNDLIVIQNCIPFTHEELEMELA